MMQEQQFVLKLLMCIFKLLIQILISLIIGNLYLADKVYAYSQQNHKKNRKTNAFSNTSLYTVRLNVTVVLSTLEDQV